MLEGSVQALETMGKLKEINGYVKLTLDKLRGIRTDLVRMDNGWQEWKFPQLVEALESCTWRNLTGQVPNIVPLTAVTIESAYYANINTTPQFERNVLMKLLSQC